MPISFIETVNRPAYGKITSCGPGAHACPFLSSVHNAVRSTGRGAAQLTLKPCKASKVGLYMYKCNISVFHLLYTVPCYKVMVGTKTQLNFDGMIAVPEHNRPRPTYLNVP